MLPRWVICDISMTVPVASEASFQVNGVAGVSPSAETVDIFRLQTSKGSRMIEKILRIRIADPFLCPIGLTLNRKSAAISIVMYAKNIKPGFSLRSSIPEQEYGASVLYAYIYRQMNAISRSNRFRQMPGAKSF
jgi:hypothetical protein